MESVSLFRLVGVARAPQARGPIGSNRSDRLKAGSVQSLLLFWRLTLSAYKAYSSSRLRAFSNTVHVVLQSVQCFSEAVCILPVTGEQHNTPICGCTG